MFFNIFEFEHLCFVASVSATRWHAEGDAGERIELPFELRCRSLGPTLCDHAARMVLAFHATAFSEAGSHCSTNPRRILAEQITCYDTNVQGPPSIVAS